MIALLDKVSGPEGVLGAELFVGNYAGITGSESFKVLNG